MTLDLGCMCRELNAADEGLWQHGKALHAAELQRHKEGGRLEAVLSGVYRMLPMMDVSSRSLI